MSDLEKDIETKLADARKRSEGKSNASPKKGSASVNKGQNSKGDVNKPVVGGKDSKPAEKKKEVPSQKKEVSDLSRKPENKSDDRKKDQSDGKGTARKVDDSKANKPSDITLGNKGSPNSKEKSNNKNSSSSISASNKKSDDSSSKVSSGSNDRATGKGADKSSANKKPNNGKTNGSKISDGDNWDDTKSAGAKDAVQDKNKVNGKKGVQEKDKDVAQEKGKKDSAQEKVKKDFAEDKEKKDVAQDKDKKDVADDKDKKDVEDKNKEKRSSSKTSRGKSRSPASRSYYRGVGGYVRGNPPRTDRRSPVRGRSRSPTRRRSRSPTRRRSPSPPRHYRDSRRWSPRRRSRSPRHRRSHSRSRHGSSSDKFTDPKALRAKKSFLDDLAVQFAQEGKEFPELEQYRCEINSQFVSYPNVYSTFAKYAVEHTCPDTSSSPMYMNLGPQMENPMMMADPYNAYPMASAVFTDPTIQNSTMISYPIAGLQPALASPTVPVALDSPQEKQKSIQFLQENKMAISDLLANQTPSLGSLTYNPSKKGAKFEVKTRISQALQLLDDLGLSIIRSTKFMYRAPTFYENNVNENRSPVVQSPTNPLFAFNSRSGETSDPFSNVPRKIKPIIHLLCMDEGTISEKIFRRQQKSQLFTNIQKLKLEADERLRRQQMAVLPKPTLQKTTQTEPTVCTECLIRKIKIRANCETQTVAVHTVDSVAQTNPLPVQTVTEFGSITELTPNQVRAVSELIRYIKLTATSGTLVEMRNTMQDDQVYTLNSDLRTAYTYFDAMVENKTESNPPPQVEIQNHSFTQKDDYNEVENYNEDDTYNEVNNYNAVDNYDEDGLPMDEYEQYHQNFCEYEQDTNISGSEEHQNAPEHEEYDDDEPFQGSNLNTFERLQQGPFSFEKNSRNAGSSTGTHHPYDDGADRGQFKQQRGAGRGRGKNNTRGRGKNNAVIFNRRN